MPNAKTLELAIDLPADQGGGEAMLAFELNCGAVYQVLSRSLHRKNSLLRRIAALPKAALVSSDGGLVSNLTAQENILLPIQYRHAVGERQALQDACSVLRRFGLDDDEIQRLLPLMPSHLSLFEKRLIGFARAMIVEPEILVCDTLFEGLTEREVAIIGKFDEVFHLYFPFRTLIVLELDRAHGIIHADKVFHLQ